MADTLPSTMTAWRQHRYGGPDAVAPEIVTVPTPGPGEVLLHVRATSLNSGDVRLMRGEPLIVRLAFGIRRPKHPGRGMDVAGAVVDVGAGVTEFVRGDEVVGELPGGGLAPYVVAPVKRLVRRPDAVDPVDAAALPIAAGTAWQALAAVDADQSVLILGASGGVGTFAAQLAALRGASVTASCGERNRRLVEDLGAEHTLDYRALDLGALPPASFDHVIVIAGPTPVRTLRRIARRSVVFVSGDGGRVLGPVGRMLRSALLGLGTGARLVSLAATPKPDDLRELLDLVAAGRLRPVVEQRLPLDRAREGLVHLDSLRAVGKTVIVV